MPREVAMMRPSGDVLGFTLLEVMIAIAILGLSLTVILSAQVGLHSTGSRTQTISLAMGLARCKMSEAEEQLLKLGYPILDTVEEGPCCADDARQDLRCTWKVELIELPIPIDSGSDGGVGTSASAALATATGTTGSLPPVIDPATGLPMATATPALDPFTGQPMVPTGADGLPLGTSTAAPTSTIPGTVDPFAALGGNGLAIPTNIPGGGNGALAGVLSTGMSGGGMSALAPMVMTFVYPSLKTMLEASIRKVTVTVFWREGIARREFELIQWVTNPSKGGFLSDSLESATPVGGAAGALGGGATGASGRGNGGRAGSR